MNSTSNYQYDTTKKYYIGSDGKINIRMLPYIPETFQILMKNQDLLEWDLMPYEEWSLPIWMNNLDKIVLYRLPEKEWAMPIWMSIRNSINWDTCPCTDKWAQEIQSV